MRALISDTSRSKFVKRTQSPRHSPHIIDIGMTTILHESAPRQQTRRQTDRQHTKFKRLYKITPQQQNRIPVESLSKYYLSYKKVGSAFNEPVALPSHAAVGLDSCWDLRILLFRKIRVNSNPYPNQTTTKKNNQFKSISLLLNKVSQPNNSVSLFNLRVPTTTSYTVTNRQRNFSTLF